jgi:predicted RNA-binding protein with TRAM domain
VLFRSAEGSAEEIEPRALPVAAGDEIQVKLEEVHLLHDADAVARLDGYVIAVADAAGKVGKKVKVRIRRVTRTAAYAVLADARPAERPVDAVPVDGEADEATKKKTRRGTRGGRGRKKKPDAGEAPAPTAGDVQAGEPEPEPVAPAEAAAAEAVEPSVEEAAAEAGADEGEPPGEAEGEEKPKKKTRRGTRGGRRRKKAEPAAEGEGVAAEAAEGG